MDSHYVDDLIDDDEIPELMEDDVARAIPFDRLPEEEKVVLRGIMAGNVTFRPDAPQKPISLALSSDLLERFTSTGEGWEMRVESALWQWLEEHPLPAEHRKAS